jgi:hypothetical protein
MCVLIRQFKQKEREGKRDLREKIYFLNIIISTFVIKILIKILMIYTVYTQETKSFMQKYST